MLIDGFELSFVSFGQLFKHVREKFAKEIKQFKIVLFDSHFDIQSNKFTHVSVSKGIFSPENRTNLENFLEVTHNTHLLVKLWRLGETCLLTEIWETEDVSTTF